MACTFQATIGGKFTPLIGLSDEDMDMDTMITTYNTAVTDAEDVLTEICNRIWRTGEWPTPWTESLIITLPKKGNLQLCQNYRTISLISHSSKVMLKGILNRLKPQAEEIIAEEQAGCRAGRSTTEQIFNLRILCEKYLQHSRICTMSSSISKKPLTEYGMQPYGPPCGSTILVQI